MPSYLLVREGRPRVLWLHLSQELTSNVRPSRCRLMCEIGCLQPHSSRPFVNMRSCPRIRYWRPQHFKSPIAMSVTAKFRRCFAAIMMPNAYPRSSPRNGRLVRNYAALLDLDALPAVISRSFCQTSDRRVALSVSED